MVFKSIWKLFQVLFSKSNDYSHTVNKQNPKEGDRKTQFTHDKQLKHVSQNITLVSSILASHSLPSSKALRLIKYVT